MGHEATRLSHALATPSELTGSAASYRARPRWSVSVRCFQSLARWLLLLLNFAPSLQQSPPPPTSTDASVNGKVTFCIKHMSDYRRRELAQLIGSIRKRYDSPILVAYEGEHIHAAVGPENEHYLRLITAQGLSAGRNALVRAVTTEYTMMIDDDVLFDARSNVSRLVAHLEDDPGLALVAGCYEQHDCYAFNFSLIGDRRMHTVPVEYIAGAQELWRAQLVHNAFLARTTVLRAHPWDERQHLMEHETFFAQLAAAHINVGFDSSVIITHRAHPESQPGNYDALRHQESKYLQYLCRNFPRVQYWQTLHWTTDCTYKTYQLLGYMSDPQPIEWDENDDASVPYALSRNLTYFIVIPSAAANVAQRDELRRFSWIRHFRSAGHWDYGFFVGIGSDATQFAKSNTLKRLDVRSIPMLGDIVRLPLDDGYARLTLKVVAALHWSVERVAARYLFKIDEDTWMAQIADL